MPSNVLRVLWGQSTDLYGRPLALVIFRNRTFEYFHHSELGVAA